jgi:ABC-2 type transport system ATP-binding protein
MPLSSDPSELSQAPRVAGAVSRPNAGRATILGSPLIKPARYLPRVGSLIEAPAFYPSLSGGTNLEVLARLGGYPTSRVSELLEVVELSDRARDRGCRW